MKCLINTGSIRTAFKTIALLTALASPVAAAWAQTPACSWPLEVTGTGATNFFFPDTDATYWVMPFDLTNWQTMTVRGAYPEARFFSFTTYPAAGNSVIDTIIDVNIAPDYGNANPFAAPAPNPIAITAHARPQYSVVIGAANPGSGNFLKVTGTGLAWVVYRLYVPDQGLDREGGVGLPDVIITTAAGQTYPLMACSPANAEMIYAQGAAKGLIDALGGSNTTAAPMCNSAVTFMLQSGSGIFPNPVTNYYHAADLCFQPGKIIVVRARAAVFPDTYDGGTIFQPAIPGTIQMRYWSMCNNDETQRRPVVACQADHDTKLDRDRFFTYVISDDQSPPSWLPPDATWLPWGATIVPKALAFRNMLPANFTLSGDYFPQGAFCDKWLFINSGWQACLAAAAP